MQRKSGNQTRSTGQSKFNALTSKSHGSTAIHRKAQHLQQGPQDEWKPPNLPWTPNDGTTPPDTFKKEPHHLINLIADQATPPSTGNPPQNQAPPIFDNLPTQSCHPPPPGNPISLFSREPLDTLTITYKMANQITEASLKQALTERLQAIHVEISDMSGTSRLLPACTPSTEKPPHVMPRHVRNQCTRRRMPPVAPNTLYLCETTMMRNPGLPPD